MNETARLRVRGDAGVVDSPINDDDGGFIPLLVGAIGTMLIAHPLPLVIGAVLTAVGSSNDSQ